MADTTHYDIIIIGAGPAGLSTALHLAKIAPDLVRRTLIIEKAQHPRPKLCGGGILPDAEVVLTALGLDITEIPHVNVDWAHVDFDNKGIILRGEKNSPFAFRVIRRNVFDAWLATKVQERGFIIQENTTVKSITVNETGVLITTDRGEYHGTVIVGADGSNSTVRRAIVPPESLHVGRLLEVITGANPEKPIHRQTDAFFDFAFVPQGIQGYTWDFPAVENGEPIRVRGIYDSNVHPGKADIPLRFALGEEFERYGLILSDYKLEGHPIRWFDAKSIFSAERILLAGDAAGVDAFFGEGISISLGYGGIAAQAIRKAFDDNDFSFQNYKKSILGSELGKALWRRTWVAKIIYRLRKPLLRIILQKKMKWIVEWVALTFLFGWARRQEDRVVRPGST
jgi:flavin-dependent dehydrogenase